MPLVRIYPSERTEVTDHVHRSIPQKGPEEEEPESPLADEGGEDVLYPHHGTTAGLQTEGRPVTHGSIAACGGHAQ